MSLFQGGGRGSSWMPKCLYFLCPYYGGREGVKANKAKFFKYSLFLKASLRLKMCIKHNFVCTYLQTIFVTLMNNYSFGVSISQELLNKKSMKLLSQISEAEILTKFRNTRGEVILKSLNSYLDQGIKQQLIIK